MTLFKLGRFTSAAGLHLDWKIECDKLTADDWDCIAYHSIQYLPHFGRVIPVPRGGIPLANAFEYYITIQSDITLVVDDVWTTGASLRKVAEPLEKWVGFVAFARGRLDRNVRAFAEIIGG